MMGYPGPVETIRRHSSTLSRNIRYIEEIAEAAAHPLSSPEITLAISALPQIGPLGPIIDIVHQSVGASRWPADDEEAQGNFVLAACELSFVAAEAQDPILAGLLLDRLREAALADTSERFATAIVAAALACTAASANTNERSRLLSRRFPDVVAARRGGGTHQIGAAIARYLTEFGITPADGRRISAKLATYSNFKKPKDVAE
jgi:hypothetical protein